MNDTTSSPSRLLQVTAVTARWMLGLLIAAWLLFALSVVVLHGWIVPRIGEYRGVLEAQATKAIGVPVRIGAITAVSEGLFPTFELHDVVLHDSLDRQALKLARVVASVSPRSLWRFNFEQIYIENPEVEVRRDAMGKLHVAGLDMHADTSGDTRAADWFFSQREFAVRGGTVRWTDETRHAEPLLLTDVSLVVRNSTRRHAMRLDATPPEGWGQRFTLRGQFRQPFLTTHAGKWLTWDGQIYAEFPHMDVARLGAYVSLDARIREANGALRLWADVNDGEVHGGALDLALLHVDAVLSEKLEPLVLSRVTGRLAGDMNDEHLTFSTTDLQFDTADGTRWPGGNLSFERIPAKGRTGSERGVFKADRLDLGALTQIASRLPLDEPTHRALSTHDLRGLLERIDASWQGPLGAPDKYQARGRVSDLAVASQPGEPAPARPPAARGTNVPAAVPTGTPGLRGATVAFDATQAGGTADIAIANGALDFPGVFEEPVVPIDQLTGKVAWKLDGPATQVQVTGLRFSNADTQGEARADWRTSDPASSRGRYPGVLDLQGQLTKADGTRVFRYLPLVIPKSTRDYVRDSVNKGTASTVDFKVRGDLHDMPFNDPKQGDFRIVAKVNDVTYAYVPPPAPGAPPAAGAWPALTGLSGELIFERAGMQVHNARGHFAGVQGIEVAKADAEIADMAHAAPLLKVDGLAKGPLFSLIKAAAPIVGGAPGEAIARARATGNADYKVRLELPLEAMDKFKLQTSVTLADNEVQPMPEAPAFTQARGMLTFTESGFSLAGVQARVAGGDVKLEGQGRYAGSGSEMVYKAQGTATAEGLRGLREVSWLSRLAKRASGSTPYAGTLSVRDGVAEFSLASSLQGLALDLPAPLAKPAADALPLRLEKKLLPRASATAAARDELQLDLGRLASIRYQRDISGNEPKVINGAIGVGLEAGESAASPARGVLANIRLARFDVDAWKSVFGEATGSPPEALGAAAATEEEASGYLPTVIAVRAQELVMSRRKLQNVVLGGSRDGQVWRANIDANDLNGYAEYRQSQDGRLYARLARLRIAPSEATEVESLLDEQPGTLPALDIVVDDFELFNRRLGRAEINAVNLGGASHEWRLNKLGLSTPEASFVAEGSWSALPATAAPGPRSDARRTSMQFTLDITDVGLLLNRFNMKDVVRRGHGRLDGAVEWRGSPFSLDYPSLGGKLHIDVESGQFLKADPGLAKLLGVLSLQALPRRLTLDFRDIFSQGFQFDFIRGDAKISDGTASTNNLQMKGVNAAVLMEGTANITRETQSLRVVVVPEISAGTAALAATVINPAIGLAAFLAQYALSKPLSAAATQEFLIDGTWADPKITKVARRVAQEAKP
ncbi:YhdP family protein [Variovorax sp. dw_308]|uniref:YhdP family protein n=1 Tax=Variovorax sp. dw_308 TaxID=2721546 RepID=UPI001C456C65|nr:YhdP family protein [Variovorax sp. dw_308]